MTQIRTTTDKPIATPGGDPVRRVPATGARPGTAVAPTVPTPSTPSPTSPLYPMGPAQREALIRRAAYILYERRGRVDGFAEQDWLRAESLIDRVLLGQLTRELFGKRSDSAS